MRRPAFDSSGSSRAKPTIFSLLPVGMLLAAACGGENPTGPDDLAGEPEILTLFEPGTVTMAESSQLLANGGLEEGDTLPTAWWNGGSSPTDFEFGWSDQDAAVGTRSISIGAAGAAGASFAFWAQSLDVVNPVGMTFQLSVSVKLDDVQGEGVSIAIRGDDSSLANEVAEAFATTQGREVITGAGEWRTYAVELHHVPSDVDRITVYFVYLPGTTGVARFDDATLSVRATIPTVELQNTDVEEGAALPDAWWSGGRGYGSYELEWASTVAFSGTRSLGLTRTTAHAEEFAFWAQTIDATNFVGGRATLSVRVRTEGLVGQGAAIAIRADDTPRPEGHGEAFASTQGVLSIEGTSGWRTYEVSLESVPAAMQSVTVYLIHLTDTAGSVYFDDITLVPG